MFEASRHRIHRASQHIRDLKAALEAYCKTDFCRIGVEADTKDAVSVLGLEIKRPLPGDVPLMLADAVHNLRAALDALACDIVKSGGKPSTRYTRFVFESSREKLVVALAAGTLKAARPDLLDLIVNNVKPYKGGDDTLCGLNDLDIDERNRPIVPVFAVTSLHTVSMRDQDKNIVKIGKLDIGTRGDFTVPTTTGPVQLANYASASFVALFDKGTAFDGQPVVPTLHRLSELVTSIVDKIQQAA